MRSIAIFLVGLVTGMTINLAHCAAQESPQSTSELPALAQADFNTLSRPEFARIDKVINAQAMITNEGEIIRLTGLDIPRPRRGEDDIAHRAKAFLDKHLTAKRVRLYATQDKKTGRTNRMGHHLRHVELRADNIWVQGALLYHGLARVRTTVNNPAMASQMYKRERKARQNERGLWAMQTYKILGPETAEQGIGAYQLVEGKVQSTAMRGNRIYLNFGKNWRSDLTVSIPPGNRRAFRRADIDPLSLGNETIRARGWLESYNGPYMEITYPARLEIIEPETAAKNNP